MATESKFVGKAFEIAKKLLSEKRHHVEHGAKLLYRTIQLDSKTSSLNAVLPHSHFQTDLCVFERHKDKNNEIILIPRLVLEFKTKISTHDVLTYSAKANRHKQIYPHLRYGIVSSEHSEAPGRFFLHNGSLDFCAAVGGLSDKDFRDFFGRLLKSELKSSKMLEDIFFNSTSTGVRLYLTVPVFR